MYISLYRKYRPKLFSDVVGQEVIVKTLKNSVVNKNFGHAYMFFGPRGVGKTTVSKIFARSVNCLNTTDGECCEKCENCLTSFENECVDIIEIDAASNNGVDEIRELKNKILLVPNKLKYKVYIIDEVHMLSIGAFNALLKTLEEPPEHVIFILATTDPQKVPDTIISRCQCFSFKPISNNNIIERMKFICKKEKILVEKGVLELIAQYSDGGMRDSLSMLDKLVSYTNSDIKIENFYELNGMISNSELIEYANAILSGDVVKFLEKNSEFLNCGKNFVNIILQFMYFLHNEVINCYLNKKSELFEDVDLVEQLIKIINEKINDIKKSEDPRIYVEILILNFINSNKNISREIINEKNIDNNMSTKEENSVEISVNNSIKPEIKIEYKAVDKVPLNINEIMKVRMNNVLVDATKSELLDEQKRFLEFKNHVFDQDYGYLVCALVDANIRAASQKGIILTYDYDSTVEQNLANLDKIIDVYGKITGKSKSISIVSENEWNNEKKRYIESVKSGNKYSFIEEPAEVFEESKKDDILNNETIDLFSDVVEIEN